MLRRLYENLRHETRFVIHIAARDVLKRLASMALILAVCIFGGVHWIAVAIIASITIGGEIIALILHKRRPEREQDMSFGFVISMWWTNIATTIAFLWPAVLLASEPSIALLLGGFMWMFGVYVHISNSYVALPLYNWSMMIPSFGAAAAVLAAAIETTYQPGGSAEWWVAGALMIVYAANTFETMTMQKDTQRALAAARAEANARLRALEHMTRHDGLTGLLTRRAFDEALARRLSPARGKPQGAVYLIDLDGFKPINDSFSHEAGDRVLIAISARMRELAGPDGLSARFGGDEFALALPGITDAEEAEAFALSLARRLEAPIEFRGKFLRVTASIGIAIAGEGLSTVSAVCAAADQAMYRAKSDTEARSVLYDPSHFRPRPSLQERQAVIEALQAGDIRPWYQPKVRLDSGEIVGFEALARWEDGERGVLLPGRFLPLINEFGLQGDFLHCIASHVLADVASLLKEGLDPGRVSLNVPEVALATLSGRQELQRLLDDAPEAARHITFEITEDVFIARAGSMIQKSVAEFRRAGVRISLDDFGTGFASFQHLRQLEFDELKIDMSFVQGLGVDPSVEVLLAGFLQIAGGLGVSVIAEGVETDDQRAQLLRLGCVFGQGWRFGRAAPLEEARIRLFAEMSRPYGTTA
ncbi:putative bifunctional diguanylate cyclase/phosphodiesterase [Pseudoroseicyclus tamaricis]|uniref:EAL domain-containing protein n=1 Tax=Pseudoroseicyclus tamaricis TaxID=2705421 RepID=A0A6B2JWF3_9RHOB|nr:EAL domain-containing protein [Pseudoroseicyclus tamaricis]NDV02618.1 EAL domain-containing protein [Pseudoroseicyclus tamaricis]